MFGPFAPTLPSSLLTRLEEDRATLAGLAPHIRHYIWADGRGALAEGPIDIDIGAGCFEPVEVTIVFDKGYPRVPPRFFDRARRWRPDDDRHLMDNHEFCLWLEHVDTPKLDTSEQFGELVLRVIAFLRDQFVFDDLGGRWPGRDWRHGEPAAYAQHALETLGVSSTKTFRSLWPLVLGQRLHANASCPCGSGLPYAHCHRAEVNSLRWLARLRKREQITAAAEGQLRDAA
jgi:hypothetical protein